MKLVIAIISNNDTDNVLSAIAKEGFFATKVSTTGQFLVDGHTGVLIVTEEDKVNAVYDLIKNNVSKRVVRTHGVTSTINGSLLKQAVDVEEHGAVAFTVNVEEFKKF
jgi:uncharacterized protein YaaQ